MLARRAVLSVQPPLLVLVSRTMVTWAAFHLSTRLGTSQIPSLPNAQPGAPTKSEAAVVLDPPQNSSPPNELNHRQNGTRLRPLSTNFVNELANISSPKPVSDRKLWHDLQPRSEEPMEPKGIVVIGVY